MNKELSSLPMYDPQKIDLPKRSDFIGAISWLKAVKEFIGEPFIFALDQALMCQGYFCGRSNEFIIWVYGDESLTKFNGVVVLENKISPSLVEKRNGLQFTNFNTTLRDSINYEAILDQQGITEALSKYYYSHGESFKGIRLPFGYCDKFDALKQSAKEYYNDTTLKSNPKTEKHSSR